MSELEPTRTYSNRTGLDPATLARSLRSMAGDGSIEWVCEPMQTRVLLDMADMLDENASLRERNTTQAQTIQAYRDESREWREVAERAQAENAKLRELVRGLNWCTENPDGPRVDCERCPLGVVDGEPFELMCEKMMRELGIEED